jgi:large subunit ribosomal protein L25
MEVPEAVEADISRLTIGDTLRVADLAEAREFQILNDPDSPVVSVAAPISEEELEAMEAAAGIEAEAPEEELEAVEGEEVPEGEEAAEAPEAGEAQGEARPESAEGEPAPE